MQSRTFGWLAALLLAVPMAANASVTYQFDFFDLQGVTGGSGNSFTISLTYDDYVTTTGMAALSAPAATTLGYPVNYSGTNSSGWWGFDDDGLASIGDFGFSFGPFDGTTGQLASFLFQPAQLTTNYYTAPGVYDGAVSGNAPNVFFGSARLTISTTPVPEPATLALLGAGLLGVAFARRRRPD